MSAANIKLTVERHTGKSLPDAVVLLAQWAFQVEGFDAEGICVFSASVNSDDLYRLGITAHGLRVA